MESSWAIYHNIYSKAKAMPKCEEDLTRVAIYMGAVRQNVVDKMAS